MNNIRMKSFLQFVIYLFLHDAVVIEEEAFESG